MREPLAMLNGVYKFTLLMYYVCKAITAHAGRLLRMTCHHDCVTILPIYTRRMVTLALPAALAKVLLADSVQG